MRLIFEKEIVVLLPLFRLNLRPDRAGIDLLGLRKPLQLPLLSEQPRCDRRKVHKACGSLPLKLLSRMEVTLPGPLKLRIPELRALYHREEGRVAAVIRPVGIDHPKLRKAWIPSLSAEIFSAKAKILEIHREGELLPKLPESLFSRLRKTAEHSHILRRTEPPPKRLRELLRGLPRLNGVDEAAPDARKLLLRELPVQKIDLRAPDSRSLSPEEDLKALLRGIRPLIILARKIFHKNPLRPPVRKLLTALIERRLREKQSHRPLKVFLIQPLHIVALKKSKSLQVFKRKTALHVVIYGLRLASKSRPLLYIDSIYHLPLPSGGALSLRCPADNAYS